MFEWITNFWPKKANPAKEIKMGQGNGYRQNHDYNERSRDRRDDRRGNGNRSGNGFNQMRGAMEDNGFEDSRRSSGPRRDSNPPTVVEEGITGSVKFFNASKGFGFIVRDDGKKDLFVHITNLRDRTVTPADGQKVRFDVGNNSRGDMAMNVEFA